MFENQLDKAIEVASAAVAQAENFERQGRETAIANAGAVKFLEGLKANGFLLLTPMDAANLPNGDQPDIAPEVASDKLDAELARVNAKVQAKAAGK